MNRFLSRQSVFTVIAALLMSAVFVSAQDEIKKNIAVMTLKNTAGISPGEAELITDRLSSELFNTGKVNVMERNQMNDILKEQGFQQSGACTDEACLVEMGQLLGVQGLVSGSIGKLGSMFMLNLRVIDVTSGAITQVVSEDVKGNIEDLVGRLGNIAERLISGKSAKTMPAPVVAAPAPEATPEPEAKSEPDAEPEEENVEAAPQVETAQIDGDKEDLNRNRGGIRLSYTGFPGRANIYVYNLDSEGSSDSTELATTNLRRLQLLFFIKAGNLFTVTLGPAIAWSNLEEKDLYSTYTEKYRLVSLEPGFNFAKRWYPFKLNAGLFVEGDMMTVSYVINYEYDDPYQSSADPVLDIAFAFGGGGRFGAEIMLGTPHVGFNMELVARYLAFTSANSISGEGTLSTLSDNDYDYELMFPAVGWTAGFNFYF